MNRISLLLIGLSFCISSFAKNTYQIDLILFAHPQAANEFQDLPLPLLPVDKNIPSLNKNNKQTDKLYTLLPPSQSGLRDEYYLLNRKSQFIVLAQYSWLQSAKKEKKIALPQINNKGWVIQGTLQVTKENYYSFNTDLQCSPPSNPKAAFTIKQKQRIEEGKIYYFDHPYIGMIVKIH